MLDTTKYWVFFNKSTKKVLGERFLWRWITIFDVANYPKNFDMRKFLALFLVLALFGTTISAQTVSACEDYNKSTGKPTAEGAVWTIQPAGGNIYLLYNHGTSTRGGGGIPAKVAFYIDKKVGSSYKEYVTEILTTDGKNFVVLDQKFTEAGDYKIGVYTMEEKLLAETNITVNLKTTSSTTTTTKNTTPSNTTTPSSSDYYASSKVIFCEEVVSNSPKNAATSFKIGRTGGYLQVQVDNGKALKTNRLIVKVYKKGAGSTDYNEFVETLEFPIEEHWDRPYFQYDFLKSGEYVFDIYNDRNVWINSGYVTINYK